MGVLDFFRSLGRLRRSQIPRVFISFAVEDLQYRDHLVRQAREDHSPFNFIDMSVKTKWPEREWRTKCRQKINRCHAVLVLLGPHTCHSSGVRWEMKCANELGIPLVGMHIRKRQKAVVPVEIKRRNVMEWNWPNLEYFITSLL